MALSLRALAGRQFLNRSALPSISCMNWSSGEGGGKGGRSEGSIREAGGAFGKQEAAREEQYFRKLQQEQLGKLKDHIDNEIEFHEEQLKHHQEAIDRHKKRLRDINKEGKH